MPGTKNSGARGPRLAVIGYGAITEEIVTCLELRGEITSLVGVLGTPTRLESLRLKARGRFPVVGTLDALLALEPDLVVEAAGHEAVVTMGGAILAGGFDLLIASVGALANASLAQQLRQAAGEHAQIWIASGAVAGIDGLLAARTAGLRSVTYTSLKPPAAWIGTPAETLLAASALRDRTIFFHGTAREAAIRYPQNANVGATIAIAGLGLDNTQVRLGADRTLGGPLGLIEAEGDFGAYRFEIESVAARGNPKTSAITGHSLVAAALEGMRFSASRVLRGAPPA